jgi:hypothetical protein
MQFVHRGPIPRLRAGTESTSARYSGRNPPVGFATRGGSIMWLSLFSIVVGISLGLGLGAVILETYGETARP